MSKTRTGTEHGYEEQHTGVTNKRTHWTGAKLLGRSVGSAVVVVCAGNTLASD